jgi:cellobiose phosphorylase
MKFFKKYVKKDKPYKDIILNKDELLSHAEEIARLNSKQISKFPRKTLLPRVKQNMKFLEQAYKEIYDYSSQKENMIPASEWLLDNFYSLKDLKEEIEKNLPKRFERQLPRIASGDFQGYPRIYGLLVELIEHTDSQLQSDTLKEFIDAYQAQVPLTSGELWAIPIILRIVLLENIRRITEQILFTQAERKAADQWVLPLLKADYKQEELSSILKSLIPQDEYSSAYAERILKRLRDIEVDCAPLLHWFDRAVAKQDTTVEDLAKFERQRQSMYQVSIGHAISSIQYIAAENWPRFFEEISLVQKALEKDPTKVYNAMDFESRDAYRHQVEKMARRFKLSELMVVRKLISRAEACLERGDYVSAHVGYDLIGPGRDSLERELEQDFGAFRHVCCEIRRTIKKNADWYYFGSLLIGTLGLFGLVLSFMLRGTNFSPISFIFLCLALLIWSSSLIIPYVNWIVSKVFQPMFLPKLELQEGIPPELRTMVVVPALLTSVERVHELIAEMEVYFLANRDDNLYFALLGDFTDAAAENLPGDEALVSSAGAAIANLNSKYGQQSFYFFHRRRIFNPSEGVWMGWERKRGKLIEFNRLLLQESDTSYIIAKGDLSKLSTIRYIITLDADTQLPRGTAKKLIGTIAHPLHAPQMSHDGKRVMSGYGIFQPRVGVSILSAGTSTFARLFSGRVGIDPYTTAISDVYQDLFGEGIFTGKGIYDVKVFHKVTNNAFPENKILSHDLIEGIYARAGLVSDVELVDGYPSSYLSYMRRLHRWVRGDWQLLSWLFKPNSLSAHWKIFDNLRRSLEAPAQLLLIIFAVTILTGEAWIWIGVISLSLLTPTIIYFLDKLLEKQTEKDNVIQDLFTLVTQFALQFILLPYHTLVMLDAITRSLYRQFVSHKYLLEWETAADTEKRLDSSFKTIVRSMWPILFFVLLLAGAEIHFVPDKFVSLLPLLLLWIASVWVAYQVSLPIQYVTQPFSDSEKNQLKLWARRIWAFFEEYVASGDNWLPPDNVQINPPNGIAHRTSPTNIGLALLANLAARDFGYISLATVYKRLENTLQTINKLKHWRGHLYNWYDTQSLKPLEPHYVSTVDSGNYVLYLLTLKSGLAELLLKPIMGRQCAFGLKVTLDLLIKEVEEDHILSNDFKKFCQALDEIICSDKMWNLSDWVSILSKWQVLSDQANFREEAAYWAKCLDKMVQAFQQETERLYPWVRNDNSAEKGLFENVDFETYNLKTLADFYRELVEKGETGPVLKEMLQQALANIQEYISTSEELQRQLEQMALAVDFRPLYNETRQLFSIGYRIADSMLDKSYYDLLASEARQASFIAIAKGDIPPGHWFKLGRSLTQALGKRSLVSWSGTMFEFLMPLLVMKNYERTLLDETYRSVVEVQKKYGVEYNVPWGISESGFYAFDPQLNYQYKAFGVPGLGLKRGLIQDLVIAPYASFLALMVSPKEALANLLLMERKGFNGRYGLYEAADFTSERIPVGHPFMLIQSFMAHHQGMSLLALVNVVFENCMQQRLHSLAIIQATELLLQERIPAAAPVQTQLESDIAHQKRQLEDLDLERNQFVFLTAADTPIPAAHFISNGQYSVMMTNGGSGFSRFQEINLSRWREDVTKDAWGMYFYIQNLNSGDVWSATYQPCRCSGEDYKVTYAPDSVEFFRKDGNITTRTEIVVSPEDQVEIRRISLTNHSQYDRILEITSYFEVVLARLNEDMAHPAFGNLFIQTEYEHEALIASRRPRSEKQAQLWLMHTLVTEGEKVGFLQYETDRARFIGRGRNLANPQALAANYPLSNTVGAVLDPIMSLRQRVRVRPGQTVRVCFSTGYAENRKDILRIADKYRDLLSVNRAFELAWTHSKMELRHLNLTADQANKGLGLGSHLLYLSPCRRDIKCIEQNSKGQSSLWPYAISGDLPIILVRVKSSDHLDLVRRLLILHEYWRLKGLITDLVILNEDKSGYVQAFQDNLRDLISTGHARELLNKSGGVFLIQSTNTNPDDIILLCTAARIIFSGEKGSYAAQVRQKAKLISGNVKDYKEKGQEKSEIIATYLGYEPENGYCEEMLNLKERLSFANGYGGFSEDGKEYIIVLQENTNTPLPWINVIANPVFGFQVSEVGAGYTWSLNSRENKLTPWSNDPILDPSGEALYLRDDETGESWSVTASPKREKGCYKIRHGQGYSIFEHCSHGLRQTLKFFAACQSPVKVIELTISNGRNSKAHLSGIYYIEWVMGVSREQTAPYLVTGYEEKRNIFFTRNTYQEEFAGRIGFLTVPGMTVTSYTGDRTEFIGRNGSLDDPAGLKLEKMSNTVGAGFDPCTALQIQFSLFPGETKTIIFLLGEAENLQEAEQIISNLDRQEKITEEFEKVNDYWDRLLGTVQVDTPDLSMNLLLNRWLLYQTVACRVWARSAFYQSGGAYGFRDQLQDVMSLVYTNSEMTKKQILLHCAHQFTEGDVQHWWHAEKGKGIRTKFSDDLLWLPFVTAHYLERTGDYEILKESIAFLKDLPLNDEEDERYSVPSISDVQGDVYDHCIRAIERSLRFGDHGLPLIGSGDWNDGFNRIGPKGKGESVWLGWFLYLTLIRFAEICDVRQDAERGNRYLRIAEDLQKSLELHGWDGGWYRRAYFDDGTPLGSAQNAECQIDAIAQSWSVISGAARSTRAQDALMALEHYLWQKEEGILLLLTPPFDKLLPDPGYIKGYVPGVRENGGQYTHGAIWAILAYSCLGDGDKAAELFHMLNPVNHARTEHEVNHYKVEPYVVAADVYATNSNTGRGGWTWYTGAAGWMYQAGLEGILGFKRQGDKLVLKPCIPSRWEGFSLTYKYLSAKYKIEVENPKGKMTGIDKITFDGEELKEPVIPLKDDGQAHIIRITL